MADAEIILTNVGGSNAGKVFWFRGVGGFRISKAQNADREPIIGNDAANALLFRFDGQTEDVSFDFMVFDDDIDVSGGTNTTTIKTIAQQVLYLKDTIYDESYDAYWLLNTISGTPTNYYPSTDTVKVAIVNIDFSQNSGEMNSLKGTIRLFRGNPL